MLQIDYPDFLPEVPAAINSQNRRAAIRTLVKKKKHSTNDKEKTLPI